MAIEQKIDQGFKKEVSRRWFLKSTISVFGGLAGGSFILAADVGNRASNAEDKQRFNNNQLLQLEADERRRKKEDPSHTPTPELKKEEIRLENSVINSKNERENLIVDFNQCMGAGVATAGLGMIFVIINESAEDSMK